MCQTFLLHLPAALFFLHLVAVPLIHGLALGHALHDAAEKQMNSAMANQVKTRAEFSTLGSLYVCQTREPVLKGRLSMADLLIKVACFVKKVNNVCIIIGTSSKLVNKRRSTVQSLSLQ